MSWTRSSSCNMGTCIEVTRSGRLVLIRNSTVPDYPLACSIEEWEAFIAGAKAGEFDDISAEQLLQQELGAEPDLSRVAEALDEL